MQNRLESWAQSLTHDELAALAVTMVERMIEIEEVSFSRGYSVPYWSATGDALVSGQDVEWE